MSGEEIFLHTSDDRSLFAGFRVIVDDTCLEVEWKASSMKSFNNLLTVFRIFLNRYMAVKYIFDVFRQFEVINIKCIVITIIPFADTMIRSFRENETT